jgi:hypothetical protein
MDTRVRGYDENSLMFVEVKTYTVKRNSLRQGNP